MIPRLAVVTGTRAEYGIFRPLLKAFKARGWSNELYVTGMHLAPQFGMTVREIEADGFVISERVDTLLASDTPSAVSKAIGLTVIGFTELLERRRPDLLFILGDRFEAMAVAIAARIAGVPIAHLHGGEVTEGAIDEAFRHSITKMSTLHFTSTATYRNRVIQLGERPSTVFDVGALGLDNLNDVALLGRADLEADLGFVFRERNLLVTQHPLTLDPKQSAQDIVALLRALELMDDVGVLITAPNADSGGSTIAELIDDFAARFADRVKVVTSLGTRRYFSLLKQVDAVVGNSSSGLIEVPSFGIPTVNIGDRQKGRLAGPTVTSVPADLTAIRSAILNALAPDMRGRLANLPNPYGDGRTADRICAVIDELMFPLQLQKSFEDLPPSGL